MSRRTDPTRDAAFTRRAERDLPGIGTACSLEAGLDARVTAFVAGYVLVLSLLAPVLATHAERFARPFGRRPSAMVPTGGVR